MCAAAVLPCAHKNAMAVDSEEMLLLRLSTAVYSSVYTT